MIPGFLLEAGTRQAERGRIPDPLLRWAIRRMCAAMLDERVDEAEFAAAMREGPIAPAPVDANVQHYEVPPELFRLVLGKRMKYSCCHWSAETPDLDAAEEQSLRITVERAGIADGMDVLELGCGWGSLTLWAAERFPGVRWTAVTNSASQAPFLERAARERGLVNVRIVKSNVEALLPEGTYDRVVSVEMFEHLWNWETMLERIAGWLRPDGRLFVHIFTHRSIPHRYRTEGPEAWLGKYFFAGGIMPSRDLMLRFDRHLRVARRWDWNGTHYARTAEAWARNLDARRAEILPVLAGRYGEREAEIWFHRWRIFFLACAELWGFRGGTEWGVGHYLLERRPAG